MMMDPARVWSLGAELGEGPVWTGGALWFVDIKKPAIHRLEPHTGVRRSWDAPELIGFVLPAQGGGFLAGLQSGLSHFDPGSGRFTPLVEVEAQRAGAPLTHRVVHPAA